MVEFAPADISVHRSILVEFTVEFRDWAISEVQKRYNVDLTSALEQTVSRIYARAWLTCVFFVCF
jgi:uncharacterized protein YPO0396